LLKVIGSFAVEEREGREYIVPPKRELALGDWVCQGLPYYSGGVTYEIPLDIPGDWVGKTVYLDADTGADVLEAWVYPGNLDGKHAGVRLWKPCRLEIGSLLQPGPNKIFIKVTNTLANMLSAARTPSGLFSVKLEAYK
jgi:hypothetical protein